MKTLTKKYWDSLPEASRYRALRKVFSNFSDSILKDYAKMKAKEFDWEWDILKKHVKPTEDTHYKTHVDGVYLA